ncbi:MAG TPA: YpdA family putative bacillithiol disulfide reductase [Acidobacteriaceae bacterium]|nr:YpdA family putative bacillithiol disulfide reductase [Acidobacteriaceae bacterium]
MNDSATSGSNSVDVLVIGAGPTGLACAIDAQNAGFNTLLLDKGCLCNSLFHYPSNMTFFTTPELLEIGNIPFSSPNQKPNRQEALEYYRKVAQHFRLKLRQYQHVDRVEGEAGHFTVYCTDAAGRPHRYSARALIVATGYYDRANYLNIPGEDLPKVFHYYQDPHPYFDQDVLVIGGKNSAAISALDLWRHGARVTLVHRGTAMHKHVKYWILPDIENRIAHDEIHGHFESVVEEITVNEVRLRTPQGPMMLKNDFVFAMTGYHPDFSFLESLGVLLTGADRTPEFDPQTLESNVPGIYLAGVVVAGARTNEIFIENGRFHGAQIAAGLRQKLRAAMKIS